MNYPAAEQRGISKRFLLYFAPRGGEPSLRASQTQKLNAKAFGETNKTQEIPRLRSGSLLALPFRQARVRLDNFSSLSFLKL
ncbi:MAG: hypothetical protein A2W91_02845 [Bacteroidetes bacterium GWF2_38_335]|nr:MAG: hypothetical protein A2W91_02845 [Bacteroidetes bacterium GWF2_38_335]OFY77569.1 MAG: hypothetical protein A2281_01915 [Bacteroidetes bacterium RIFOXYA12_FULL_38_20]HBS87130.1 hypothetical protein [Bacteroidales bacterium]